MSGPDLSRFRVIVLSGEEFQRGERLREILEEVVDPSTRDFNLDIFSADNLRKTEDAAAVTSLLVTYPMMADRRVIVLKSFDSAPQDIRKKLAAPLRDTPETTLVIIEGEKVSLSPKPPKEFVYDESFKVIYENKLPGWIQGRFAKRGKKAAPDAMALLINNAGTVLGELDNEIEKITVVAGDRETISARLVEAVVGEYRRDTVWNLCNAVGAGDFGGASHILQMLMSSEKNKESFFLATIISHIVKLGAYNTARKNGMPQPEAMKLLVGSPFLWKMNQYDKQTRNFPPDKVKNALVILAEAESSMKSSGTDNGMILEIALARVMK